MNDFSNDQARHKTLVLQQMKILFIQLHLKPIPFRNSSHPTKDIKKSVKVFPRKRTFHSTELKIKEESFLIQI
jgi:hypothetical protein